MDLLEDKKLEIVCKKLGCGYGFATVIGFVRCWCMGEYRNMPKKNAENCDCVGVCCFAYYLCIALVVLPDGKKTCGGRASSWSRDG